MIVAESRGALFWRPGELPEWFRKMAAKLVLALRAPPSARNSEIAPRIWNCVLYLKRRTRFPVNVTNRYSTIHVLMNLLRNIFLRDPVISSS